MKRKTKLIRDLLVVLGLVLIGVPIVLKFQVRPLTSSIFFFILPASYLLYLKPRRIKRILTGSFLFGILFGFVFDFLAIFNKAWSEPVEQLIFKFKILGIVPIDHIIWFFFWTMIILVFYEHFVEHERSDKLSHNFKYALFPSIIVLLITVLIFTFNENFLRFSYAYLLLGLAAVSPLLFVVFRYPLLLPKFFKVGLFFIFLFLVYELTAVKLGQWYFPGEYIGHLKIIGLEFPFEEFLFWILLSSSAVLSYYEWLVDDER